MTEGGKWDALIDEIILKEILGSVVHTNDPDDRGGETFYGLTRKHNPEVWDENGIPQKDRVYGVYEKRYITGPGFDRVPYPDLQRQLIDFGVNSGPAIATIRLQTTLKVTPDGILGPKTLAAIETYPSPSRLNNLLALERVKMIGRIIHKDPTQVKWINGWLNRALSFILP